MGKIFHSELFLICSKAVKTELDLSKFSQMNGLEVLRISSLCGLTLKNQKCLNNLSQLKSLKALVS